MSSRLRQVTGLLTLVWALLGCVLPASAQGGPGDSGQQGTAVVEGGFPRRPATLEEITAIFRGMGYAVESHEEGGLTCLVCTRQDQMLRTVQLMDDGKIIMCSISLRIDQSLPAELRRQSVNKMNDLCLVARFQVEEGGVLRINYSVPVLPGNLLVPGIIMASDVMVNVELKRAEAAVAALCG